MTQDEINRAEWENPENWTGPGWMAIYFSKVDTRTWVPNRRFPRLGWTQNLGRAAGLFWVYAIVVGLFIISHLFWILLVFPRFVGAVR